MDSTIESIVYRAGHWERKTGKPVTRPLKISRKYSRTCLNPVDNRGLWGGMGLRRQIKKCKAVVEGTN